MNPNEKKSNVVWIACRAKEGCPGNQAEILANRPIQNGSSGAFEISQGGRVTRYRCQTCTGSFTITT